MSELKITKPDPEHGIPIARYELDGDYYYEIEELLYGHYMHPSFLKKIKEDKPVTVYNLYAMMKIRGVPVDEVPTMIRLYYKWHIEGQNRNLDVVRADEVSTLLIYIMTTVIYKSFELRNGI